MRSLIMDYITAYNNDDYSLAENLLFKIKQAREQNESND
jgi:predicted DNA-binding protein